MEEKQGNIKQLQEIGVIDENPPKLSKIEIKLRKKLTIIRRQMGSEKLLGKRKGGDLGPGASPTKRKKPEPVKKGEGKVLNLTFKYKQNKLLEDLQRSEKEKEYGVVL